MNKLQQKLKSGVQYVKDKAQQFKLKIKNKIKGRAQKIKAQLNLEKQMLKDGLSWLRKNFQEKKKHHDIRKSLRRLAAPSFWPKSVMEKYYQQEILPLIGTDAGL